MASLQEIAQWELEIYQWATTDYAEGGAAGILTLPLRQLANRTAHLKGMIDAIPAALTLYDNDDMSPDSATGVASQQSIKAYVAALIATIPAAFTLYDNDDMSPNSATGVASQQSIKAYVDEHATSLGAWASKGVNTIYQAATDGFVCVYLSSANNDLYIKILTDGNNPPTTGRNGSDIDGTGAELPDGTMSPVRAGDYWKVDTNATGVAVYWLPFTN